MSSKTQIVTPKFRVSYPSLIKPQLNKLNGKMEFSVEALFTGGKEGVAALKAAAKEAAIEMWGDKPEKWPKFKNDPFKLQDEKEKEGILAPQYKKGDYFLRFRSEQKPGLVDELNQAILDPHKIYAGCYARAHVNAYAYDKAGNAGVSFSLNHVQFLADGEAFSSRPNVESAFTPVDTARDQAQAATAASLFD